jgi:NAD(P)-dependent dehydrogenase (short-subunit alcohol dehydrogenase family)
MEGKTVLITGGNSGLGLETVRDLAKRGANIVMASRKVDVATKVRGQNITIFSVAQPLINIFSKLQMKSLEKRATKT